MLRELSSFSALFSYQTLLIFVTMVFLIITKIKQRHLPPSPWSLPLIGHLHLLGPMIHQSLHYLSARYGPLMHLQLGSVPCIVASSPEIAKELLKTHELTFSARKHSIAVHRLTYNASFAFAPYGPYWKLIKKQSQMELLGSKSLNLFLPIRTEQLHQFLTLIYHKSLAKETVNVTQELMKLTNNIMSHMMLSIRCSETNHQAEEVRTLVREVTRIFGEFNISDFVKLFKNMDLQGFRARIEDIHKRYDALLEKIINDREELRKSRKGDDQSNMEENAKDFLDMMLDVMDDDSSKIKLTRDHVKALVLDFLTAGTDTSTTAIEWALAELINHPTKLEKAREEIQSNVGNDRIVQESDIRSLPYIRAIIKETLRLHPPIPMLIRKSTKQCVVKGYTIPPDTLLFVNIWSIGRDTNVWENPLEFKPERFYNVKMDNEIDVKGQHFELLPFGSGRRGCPGISLAMLELPTTLATMIQCFEWEVKSGVVDMGERPGLTAPKALDLICTPIPRLSSLLHSLES